MLYFLGHPVEIVRRARRRTLTIKVQESSLRVLTNQQVKTDQILAFLNSKENWIAKHLNQIKIRQTQFPKPTLQNGSHYPWLGERKYFQFAESKKQKVQFKIEDGFLICYVAQALQSSSTEIQRQLIKFYKTQAIQYLETRVSYWSDVTGLYPNQLQFRSPRSRWGSCSSQKHISLNWKLICQSPALIDYVIVHELCHLQHLNHSTQFWNLVVSHLPDYQVIEKVLQDQVYLGNFLDHPK